MSSGSTAGAPACEGREQVLAWLRSAPAQLAQVDALELLADDDHAMLAVRDHARQELAGIQLDGQLFTVFTLREGQIVHLPDPRAPGRRARRRRTPRLPAALTPKAAGAKL